MFDTILVPIDGSDPATRAARFGLELATAYDASVELLHVVPAGDDAASERGEQLLDETAALVVDGDPEVRTRLAEGKPAKTIVSRAEEAGSDLVVMGRHSRRGISQHLLGSTTERVLRNVGVPVLTIPGSDTGPVPTVENVLLTTDRSPAAARAGPYGIDLARRLAATLHLLSVVDVQAEAGPFNAGGVDREYVERLEAEGREALDRLTEGVDTSELDVREALVRGWAIEEIRSYVDEHDVDVLVIASEGQTNLVGQRLGSTASRVLDTVQRPVLVVPVRD